MADRFRALNLAVDLHAGEVRRDGRPLDLPPRALEILAVLSKRPGELVTRDEIRTAVWNGAYVDFDRSVNLYVSLLRKAFGDDARAPRYIETIPRKGYRFIAPVEEEAERIRIVVLPFENLGPADDMYLSHGMTDELLFQLGRLVSEGLEVVATSTAPPHSRFGATHLVSGTVRKSADDIRIVVRLVSGRDETILWTDTFQGTMLHVLAVQSQMARSIATEIRLQLSPRMRPGAFGGHSVSAEAYECYLRGRHLHFSPQRLPNRRGVEYLRRAVELAPDFAAPRCLLAEVLLTAAAVSAVDPNAVRKIVKEDAQRAVEIAPESSEAWAFHALVRATVDWDWAGAEEEAERALSIAATVDTLRACGLTLVLLGRFDDALSLLERAAELGAPSLRTSFQAGWAFHRARRYSDAIEWLERTVAIDPSGSSGSVFLAECYLHEGKPGRARDTLLRRLAFPGAPMMLGYAASIYGRLDCESEARALVERLEVMSRTSFVDPYYLAAARAGLGQSEVALDDLERGVNLRSFAVPIAKFDSFLDPLRSAPRFDAIVGKLDQRRT